MIRKLFIQPEFIIQRQSKQKKTAGDWISGQYTEMLRSNSYSRRFCVQKLYHKKTAILLAVDEPGFQIEIVVVKGFQLIGYIVQQKKTADHWLPEKKKLLPSFR